MEPDMKTTTILVGALLAAGATETVNFDKAEAGQAAERLDGDADRHGPGQMGGRRRMTRRQASRTC